MTLYKHRTKELSHHMIQTGSTRVTTPGELHIFLQCRSNPRLGVVNTMEVVVLQAWQGHLKGIYTKRKKDNYKHITEELSHHMIITGSTHMKPKHVDLDSEHRNKTMPKNDAGQRN